MYTSLRVTHLDCLQGDCMTVADDLESVIDELAHGYQAAARELVAEIRARPEENQLVALRELIADRLRALNPESEEGDGE